MRRGLKSLVVAVVTPPLVVVKFVAGKIYSLLFGAVDRRHAARRERELAQEIEATMPFLFAIHSAKVVPNEGTPSPPAFDYAFVTVAVGHLLLRFVRGRNELRVQVASSVARDGWYDLSSVLDVIGLENIHTDRESVTEVAQLLGNSLNQLERAFSVDEYPRLQEQLSKVHAHNRAVLKQWQTEINRRIYG